MLLREQRRHRSTPFAVRSEKLQSILHFISVLALLPFPCKLRNEMASIIKGERRCGSCEMNELSIFISAYDIALQRRPYLAQSCTAAVLFGAGDVLAQQGVEKKGRDHDVRSAFPSQRLPRDTS